MKKLFVLLLALTAAAAWTGCCAGAEGAETIVFWHATGGANGELLEEMVEEFNASQSEIHVDSQFQGRYEDALIKLKSAMQGGEGPDVVQVFDVGTKFMIDSGVIVPIEDFIGGSGFSKNDIEANLISYYSDGGRLQGMPFNASTPILFYNKDAFAKAGLDPEKTPATFEELKEMGEKLIVKEGNRVMQYGLATPIYGWFFEQMIAGQARYYANNDNGRGSQNASAVAFDQNGAGLKAIDVWRDLVDSGVAGNFGRKVDDSKNAFIAGNAAMTFLSTAQIASLNTAIGGRFEMGTGYMPKIGSNPDGGIVIGGAALWVIDSGADGKKNAAWEFVKYLSQPEQQAKWSRGTGYFAVNTKSYDLPEMQAFMLENPNFKTAVAQLQENPANKFTQGAMLGVFQEARVVFEESLERAILGEIDNRTCLNDMASKINAAITNYNATAK